MHWASSFPRLSIKLLTSSFVLLFKPNLRMPLCLFLLIRHIHTVSQFCQLDLGQSQATSVSETKEKMCAPIERTQSSTVFKLNYQVWQCTPIILMLGRKTGRPRSHNEFEATLGCLKKSYIKYHVAQIVILLSSTLINLLVWIWWSVTEGWMGELSWLHTVRQCYKWHTHSLCVSLSPPPPCLLLLFSPFSLTFTVDFPHLFWIQQ